MRQSRVPQGPYCNTRPRSAKRADDSGLHTKEEIAIPVKGNFFFRLGVHDKVGDQVGALEIPVDQIRLGVPAAGAPTQ